MRTDRHNGERARERGRRLFNNRRQTACCRRPIRNDSSFHHRASVNFEAVPEITRGCENVFFWKPWLRKRSLSYYLEGGKISKVPSSARSRCYSSVRGRRRKLGLSGEVKKPRTMQKQFGSLQTLELWRGGWENSIRFRVFAKAEHIGKGISDLCSLLNGRAE